MKKWFWIYSIFLVKILQAETDFYHVYLEELSLSNRIGFKYNYKENLESTIPIKEQQFIPYAEYKISNFYSIYFKIPYTIKWSESSEKRKFFDHVRITNKFSIDGKLFEYALGLAIDLPRNHDNAGDVAGNIGYIEPYGGIIYGLSSFKMKLSLHWNTQTNIKLKEELEEFQRKWIYNLSFGYIPKNFPWKIWLEAQYQYIYEPKERKKNIYLLGPCFSYSFSSFEIEFIYLLLSKENEYNKQFLLQLQKTF